jgi:hypothetical protein
MDATTPDDDLTPWAVRLDEPQPDARGPHAAAPTAPGPDRRAAAPLDLRTLDAPPLGFHPRLRRSGG